MPIQLTINTICGLRSHNHQFTLNNDDDIIELCGNAYRMIMSAPSGVELGMNADYGDPTVEEFSDQPLDMDEYCVSEYGSAMFNDHDGLIDLPYSSRQRLDDVFKDCGELTTWYQKLDQRITGITCSYTTVD
jgi:hypothetical protein